MALVLIGRCGLDLYEHAGNAGDRFQPTRTGLDHLAFVANTLEDLNAWAAWLDSHQVPHSEIRDVVGAGTMFDLVDPDGIQIEFFFVDDERLRRSDLFWAVTEAR